MNNKYLLPLAIICGVVLITSLGFSVSVKAHQISLPPTKSSSVLAWI